MQQTHTLEVTPELRASVQNPDIQASAPHPASRTG